eukprot:728447-Prymnesium_polylepis.1
MRVFAAFAFGRAALVSLACPSFPLRMSLCCGLRVCYGSTCVLRVYGDGGLRVCRVPVSVLNFDKTALCGSAPRACLGAWGRAGSWDVLRGRPSWVGRA